MEKSHDGRTEDYGSAGIDIQRAMVRDVRAHPSTVRRPRSIQWNGQPLWTSFAMEVPRDGRFRIEFLSEPHLPLQGLDVVAEAGTITLAAGERVKTLRTWHDPRFEDVVEYAYTSKDGLLMVWNVYHRSWPDGRTVEEKWTDNAGFRAEQTSEGQWLFRCSPGPSDPPDFDQLVVRFSVLSP